MTLQGEWDAAQLKFLVGLGGWRRAVLRWGIAWGWLGLFAVGAGAQSAAAAPVAPPATAQGVLLEMAAEAGVIFTGQVVGIDRAEGNGYVDVRFRVDHAVRGVAKTGAYVLREWAGLWVGGLDRYSVGQRYLMLLTVRGTSGMSSPVHGMDGAIPLVAGALGPIADGNGLVAPDAALTSPELWVDVRWLAAGATRTAGGGGKPGWRPMEAPATGADKGSTGNTPGDRSEPIILRRLGAGPASEGSLGWAGAISPLASPGTGSAGAGSAGAGSAGAGSSVQGLSLSAILTLLQGGSAHAAR